VRTFPNSLLARLFLTGSVCLLTIAPTTGVLSPVALLDVPAVANHTQGVARHAVEEVGGSSPVADAGVFTASLSRDAEENKEGRPEPPVLDAVEGCGQWPGQLRFHRRIPPRSGDDDN